MLQLETLKKSVLDIPDDAAIDVTFVGQSEGYDGHCLRAYSYWPEKFAHIPDTVKGINTIKKDHEEIRSKSKAPTFALTR